MMLQENLKVRGIGDNQLEFLAIIFLQKINSIALMNYAISNLRRIGDSRIVHAIRIQNSFSCASVFLLVVRVFFFHFFQTL